MARSTEPKRRPRIRKSAPTVRELAEAARTKSESKQKGRLRRLVSRIFSPIKRLKIGQSRLGRIFKKFGRGISRAFGWLVPSYFVNSWRELRKVQWPNRRETWRLTLAVFVFSVVFGALVAGVDKGLDEIFKKVVLK